MTGNSRSTLARAGDVVLDVGVKRNCCVVTVGGVEEVEGRFAYELIGAYDEDP